MNGERESIQKVREILHGSFFFWATVNCHVLGGKAQSFNFKSDMLQLRNLEAAAHTIGSPTYTLASRISNCTLLKIAGAKGSLLLYLHVNGTLECRDVEALPGFENAVGCLGASFEVLDKMPGTALPDSAQLNLNQAGEKLKLLGISHFKLLGGYRSNETSPFHRRASHL